MGNKSILVRRVDGFKVGNSFGITPTISIRYDRAQISAPPSLPVGHPCLPLEFGYRGQGNTGKLPPTPKKRKCPASNADYLLHFFAPEIYPIQRSASLFSSPVFAPHIDWQEITPSRILPVPSTNPGLEVANRALSLFCLLREVAVVIDAWIRFHRGTFGIYFRDTRYSEMVRSLSGSHSVECFCNVTLPLVSPTLITHPLICWLCAFPGFLVVHRFS